MKITLEQLKQFIKEEVKRAKLSEQFSRDPVADRLEAVFVVRYNENYPELFQAIESQTSRPGAGHAVHQLVQRASPASQVQYVELRENIGGSPGHIFHFAGGAVPMRGRRAAIARALANFIGRVRSSARPARIRDFYIARPNTPETPLPGEANT